MIKVKKNFQLLFLISVIAMAFFLRSYHLSTDLLFHRDQGVHSLDIWEIWHDKKLSLLGPTSDTDGLTHAPIYYWLMLPSYALSGGDPVVASLFQIIMEVLSLPFLFLAVKKLFNKKTAIITLLLYTFSYRLICYSRWLVNVTPILPLTNVLLFLLADIWKIKASLNAFLSALVVGVATQIDAAVGLFLLPVVFYANRKNLKLKRLGLILLGFLLPAFPLLVFELRHDFVLSNAVLNFSRGGGGIGFSFKILFGNFKILKEEVTHMLFSALPSFIVVIITALGLFFVKNLPQKKLIYAFLLLHFLTLSLFQRGAISFFFVGLLPLLLAIIAFAISKFPQKIMIICLGLIIGLNIFHLKKIYQPTNALIPIGNANLITIQDRKNIIDWIYKKADGQSFAIWYYTIPYYQEEVWDYMFFWYAEPKYGYLPEATHGFSPNELKEAKIFFSVFEPELDRPQFFTTWHNQIGLNFGEVIDQYQTNDLHVRVHEWDGIEWKIDLTTSSFPFR